MKNKLNPFEEQLKGAANNFEAPYDASQWSKLETQLDKQAGGGMSSLGKLALVAVALTAVFIGYYFIQDSNPINNQNVIVTELEEPNNLESESVELSEFSSDVPENIVVEQPQTLPAIAETKDNVAVSKKQIETSVKVIEPKTIVSNDIDEEPDSKVETKKEENHIAVEESLNTISLPFITTKNLTVCAGTSILMNFEEPLSEEVVWNLGNGNTAQGASIEYTYLEAGEYAVFAFLAKDPSVITNTLKIKINPKPDATFTVTEKMEEGLVPVVHVNVQTEGEKHYAWNFGDGSTSTGENSSHTYQAKGDFEISLNVVNKYGCFWPAFQRYTNEVAYNLLAAGNFSPNGDGTNDYWMPKALGSGYYAFELQIYDRNNNVVFTTSDPNQRWDGTVNGVTAKSGEFFAWKATVVEPDKQRFQYGGSIILIY